MLSKWSWIVLNLIVCVCATSLQGETKAFLELLQLDYEDACYNIANVQWSFITSPSNETLSAWEAQQYKYAEFKKTQKAEVSSRTGAITDDVKDRHGSSLQYKYDVIEKPGDALLKEEDWKNLVHFVGAVELKRSTIDYANKSQNYSREDMEYLLSHNRKLDDKKTAWNTWYSQLKPLLANYTNNLALVAEAAKENDAESVEEYWEMLTGYRDAYEGIKSDWHRIKYLHNKILKFVSANLAQKYGITVNDTLPAYLLGSLQGYDWTDLSSDVLPYPDLIHGIKKDLWKKKHVGKSLYKTASSLGSMLLKHVPQAEFWDKSEFNRQCPSRLLNFCQDGIMGVSTCSKATVSNFLAAHKDVGTILFNQMTVENTPVLNTVNRYSGLEEGISTLFGILSASPAWLNHTHLMNATSENEQHMIVSLMITALDILPRLAYYYSVDMWRINAIKKNITDPADLVSSWWKYRQEYEGISSIDMNSPTFLDDSYIINNKPYLPKILGIIVGFQLYEYTLESTEVRYNIDGKLINANIIKMIQHGGDRSWPEVLDKSIDIDDIAVDALISYFTPLEEFIEESEENYEYKSGSREEKELEELEKHVLQEINNPTTVPPPTTTTTVRTKMKTAMPSKTASDGGHARSELQQTLKPISSVYVREHKVDVSDSSESNPTVEASTDKSLTPDTLDDTQDSKPKISTSKAVWAVSAILIAVIAICMIVIFGRQRCRKTPKNRRYV